MKKILVVVMLVAFITVLGNAQQPYVGKFDAFGGFSYLSTPSLNLTQRGFNTEFGVNHNRWLALGIDISYFNGHSSLGSDPLSLGIKTKLAPLMSKLPAGTQVSVPFDSSTFTMSVGPQINIRKIKAVTFFVRPAGGWLHVRVTAKPNSIITTGVVQQLLGPSKTSIVDDVAFYGFGGGLDLNLSKHVALRMSSDFIHLNMFSDLLADNRNTVRFSVGPTFRFGKNVE